MRKKIIILIIVVLAVCVLPLPIPVIKTLEGYVFDVGEEEKARKATVEMRGIYWLSLFRDDVYSGNIEITGGNVEEFEITQDPDVKMRDLTLWDDWVGIVTYENDFEGNYSNLPGADVMGWRNLGGIYTKGMMSSLTILMAEPLEEGRERLLVAPVEEAEDIPQFLDEFADEWPAFVGLT